MLLKTKISIGMITVEYNTKNKQAFKTKGKQKMSMQNKYDFFFPYSSVLWFNIPAAAPA